MQFPDFCGIVRVALRVIRFGGSGNRATETLRCLDNQSDVGVFGLQLVLSTGLPRPSWCNQEQRTEMAIELDEVLKTLGTRILEDEEVQEALTEGMHNAISSAETAFSLKWDGGSPVNTGGIWIVEWLGLYFVSSSDYEDAGPFDSLEGALGCECFEGGAPNAELDSSELSVERLKQLAVNILNAEDDQDTIKINGGVYVLESGELTLRDSSE